MERAVVGARYKELLAASAASRNGHAPSVGEFAKRLEDVRRACGFPGSLEEAGVPSADLESLARDAAAQWTGNFNPRPLDEAGAAWRLMTDARAWWTRDHLSVRAARHARMTAVRCRRPRTQGIAGASSAQQAGGAAQDEWAQFRGNRRLTGVAPANAAAVPATPKVLWTWDAGDAIESSAAISGDLVFIGAATGELVALNLSDGKKRWTYKTTKPIGESSPAVAGGLVFIGDLGGVVHAVKVSDGTAAWTHKTEGEIKSSPVPLGDRVLIGSYDGSLYCLSAKDGKVLWSLKTENYVHGTPAVDDTAAYLAGCDEVFRAVRISDGQPLFTMPIGAYTGASVALQQNQAFFGTFNNEVMALDLQSKKMLWKYAPKDRQFPFYSSAAVADGKVVLGGRDKMVHALDAKTGKLLWTFTTRARRLVTGDRRRPRLRRLERRPRLRPRPGQRQESLGIRSRLARDVLPGRREGQGRRRHGRRPGDLLRMTRKG